MSKPLMMTKVKNMFREFEGLEFSLKNIRINGDPRGCSGFIRNANNGKIVYLNTEQYGEGGLWGDKNKEIMYRTAPEIGKYSNHGYNQWCSAESLVKNVLVALEHKNGAGIS